MNTPIFENVKQILNMGGPWIADAFVKNNLVVSNVLADDYLYDNKREVFFFIKFFNPTSKRKDVYFSIIIYLVRENVIKRHTERFNAITFGDIDSKKIDFHNSFNSDFSSTKEAIEINELISNCILVNENVV